MTNTTAAAISPAFIEDDPATDRVEPEGVAIEATRYLFFAGNLIEPRRQRMVKRLRWGGEELETDYRCFTITRNHLWRNMMVPMTRGRVYEDDQLISDDQRNNAVTRAQSFGPPRVMYELRREPGEEIRTLLFGKSDLPMKGVVEIKALRAVDWADFKKNRVQQFFFPDWDNYRQGTKTMPVELAWTRSRINEARSETSETTLQDIADDMLNSVEQFYAWGTEYLKRETKLVKTPPAPGSTFIYTYSGLAESLFTMLGHQREDFLRQDFGGQLSYGAGVGDPEMKELLKKQAENQALLIELLARQRTNGDGLGLTAVPEEVKEVVTSTVKTKAETVLCAATKKDGEPCGAPPKGDSEFCVFHQ